ncbi:phasin family protein [Duganella caerulea]|uniref:phasin family protein n=1 Tax=Duganella caerulea TaxID=2885762 RepID=UPI0040377A0C
MAKKLKRHDDQQTAEVVRMSSQEIWQAGLSAFAKAQEEEGKFFSMQLFEERVLRALSSIGVPTAKEVEALTQRVDELTRQVIALGGTPAPAKKPAAAKAAAKAPAKPAAKPAAKKTAAAPAEAKPPARARAKTSAK